MIKQRLERELGIPAKDMKLRVSGSGLVMIDTASNIRVGSAGTTQGALAGLHVRAREGQKTRH